MFQCPVWIDEAKLNQLHREGVRYARVRLFYFFTRSVSYVLFFPALPLPVLLRWLFPFLLLALSSFFAVVVFVVLFVAAVFYSLLASYWRFFSVPDPCHCGIVVWIRNCGSVPLMNGSGSSSWSCCFRRWPSGRQKKSFFLPVTFWKYTVFFTLFFDDKKSERRVEIKGFLTIFAWWVWWWKDWDLDPYLWPGIRIRIRNTASD